MKIYAWMLAGAVICGLGLSLRAQSATGAANAMDITQTQGLPGAQSPKAATRDIPRQDPGKTLSPVEMAAICSNNLRQIEAAKDAWSYEGGRVRGSDLDMENLKEHYLPEHKIPICPAGGTYTFNVIAVNAECSIPGHSLEGNSLLGADPNRGSQPPVASSPTAACIDNLLHIEAGKDTWALDTGKRNGEQPDMEAVMKILKWKIMPTCPAGGRYTINPVGSNATCTIPGHVFP